jgi:hypothetical protein
MDICWVSSRLRSTEIQGTCSLEVRDMNLEPEGQHNNFTKVGYVFRHESQRLQLDHTSYMS